MYAASVVGTSEVSKRLTVDHKILCFLFKFFWDVIERKLGKVPREVTDKLNELDRNTFAFWKGVDFWMSGCSGSLTSRFWSYDLNTSQESKDFLNSIAGISKLIDPEKEAHDEYKCRNNLPL